jgi:hypothetical protein
MVAEGYDHRRDGGLGTGGPSSSAWVQPSFIVEITTSPQLVDITVAPADQSGSPSMIHGTGWNFHVIAPVLRFSFIMLRPLFGEGSVGSPDFVLPVVM